MQEKNTLNKNLIFKRRLSQFSKKIEKEPFLRFIPKLLKEFPESEIYLVGGAVRDALLKKQEIKDFDFVVRGVKPIMLKKFLEKLGDVNLVGRNFGVYKFYPKGYKLEEAIDIALPRTEHSLGTGGGYRDFKVQSDYKMTIEDDLSRRDFTINALALDIQNNTIIDPFSGLTDLKKKTIRTVGEPEKRFKEDYSRMLRALRFSCQLGFKIESKTYKSIKYLISHVNDSRKNKKGKKERVVPYETISRELLKSFYQDPLLAFDLYDKSGASKELMPEIYTMKGCPQPRLYHTEGDVWKHTRLSLENLNSIRFKRQFYNNKSVDAELVIATLFHDIGKPVTIKTPKKDKSDRIRFNEHDIKGAEIASRICKRLKLDSQPQGSHLRIDIEDLYWLIAKHLLLVHGNVMNMRSATIEKYFFNPHKPGENLLKLIYTDSISTIPKEGKPDMKNFYDLTKRIKELEKLSEKRKKLPKRILTGNEIMRKFKLESGPKIGKLLIVVREAQLSGKIINAKNIKDKKDKAYKVLDKYLKSK